jgi:hypothetical protein
VPSLQCVSYLVGFGTTGEPFRNRARRVPFELPAPNRALRSRASARRTSAKRRPRDRWLRNVANGRSSRATFSRFSVFARMSPRRRSPREIRAFISPCVRARGDGRGIAAACAIDAPASVPLTRRTRRHQDEVDSPFLSSSSIVPDGEPSRILHTSSQRSFDSIGAGGSPSAKTYRDRALCESFTRIAAWHRSVRLRPPPSPAGEVTVLFFLIGVTPGSLYSVSRGEGGP